MKTIRDIFKVGYGPSSSHTIGPSSAARMFMSKNPTTAHFRVSLYGSLAATGVGHQTDVALKKSMVPNKVEIAWFPHEELPMHPNGLLFEALDNQGTVTESWRVYSIGGGDLQDENNMRGLLTEIYPIETMAGLITWCRENGKQFWEHVDQFESPDIWEYLAEVWQVMKDCIHDGLENEGVLPGPIKLARKAASYHIQSRNSASDLRTRGSLFAYALAVSEQNASGAKVVTAPTCGSAGVLPALLYFLQETHQISDARIIRGLATAGLIGNLVKTNGSISGAEVGCQGEIGSACAMAAGAATQILGGTIAQVEYAAEMAFEHNLGLTCDPVLGFVQIPCIERNAFGAHKANEAALFALFSDGTHKISFDEVVKTMLETGRDLQSKYRETGMGGLALNYSL